MEQFVIDRAQGVAIWIDVEQGIVKRCYNSSFDDKLNERYAGKQISFLKTDFETRMKPSYTNVRPLATMHLMQRISVISNRININHNKIKRLNVNYSGRDAEQLTAKQEAKKADLKANSDTLLVEQHRYHELLEVEKQRLVDEHQYA